ncbi:hypothetical protein TNCV_2472031 [Trichonephila clavipes]|nr:hypothetical protein TNCV_2472031 [Trichonephila clavipes]
MHKRTTASQISRYLYVAKETRVLRVTLSKRLYERGLFFRRPAVFVPLTSTNRRPLAWRMEYGSMDDPSVRRWPVPA